MANQKFIPINNVQRQCGSCTKCCEGWLFGEAHDKKFWPGRPCHYLSEKKCSIYDERPVDPCVTYTCAWLANEDIPGWLKPSEVNAIITFKTVGDISYIEIVEAGETLKSKVLSWAIMYAMQNNMNIKYAIDGGSNKIGSQEFLQANI